MPSAAPACTTPTAYRAHKFGGSSVADATCYRNVVALLAAQPAGRQVVVVSAMHGVTDALVALAADAAARADAWSPAKKCACSFRIQ